MRLRVTPVLTASISADLHDDLRRDEHDQDVEQDCGDDHLSGPPIRVWLQEETAGAHGPHLETHREEPTPQAHHVDVEGVAAGLPARPRHVFQRVAPDDLGEATDESLRKCPLDTRQRDPLTSIPQDAVLVDAGSLGCLTGVGTGERARAASVLARARTSRSTAGSRIQSSRASKGFGAADSVPTSSSRGMPEARRRSTCSRSSGQRTSTTSVMVDDGKDRPLRDCCGSVKTGLLAATVPGSFIGCGRGT